MPPAAVVSMAVLRVLGGSTILENNIVQTGASAGSSIASGVIFTIPALVILGHWADFQYLWVLAIAGLELELLERRKEDVRMRILKPFGGQPVKFTEIYDGYNSGSLLYATSPGQAS